jgi:hypothetical protein
MDIAYISALSALAGSVIGGFTSGLINWMAHRAQARVERLRFDLSRRQELFADFIVAASKLYGDALMSSEPPLQEVVAVYAMISRMRVLCSPRTVECADKIMHAALDTFFAPNKTMRELHDIVKSGAADLDPLKEFSELARGELRSLA